MKTASILALTVLAATAQNLSGINATDFLTGFNTQLGLNETMTQNGLTCLEDSTLMNKLQPAMLELYQARTNSTDVIISAAANVLNIAETAQGQECQDYVHGVEDYFLDSANGDAHQYIQNVISNINHSQGLYLLDNDLLTFDVEMKASHEAGQALGTILQAVSGMAAEVPDWAKYSS